MAGRRGELAGLTSTRLGQVRTSSPNPLNSNADGARLDMDGKHRRLRTAQVVGEQRRHVD